jgi:hypothetical protein
MNRRTDTLPTIPFSLAALCGRGGMYVPSSYMCVLKGIVCGVEGDVTCDDMRCDGGERRVQRGAGVDHLAQVQQKNVQTDTRYFSTLSHLFCYSFMSAQNCVHDYPTPSPIPTLEGTVLMVPISNYSAPPGY